MGSVTEQSQANGGSAAPNGTSMPPLYDHPIDDYRPLRIVCIGAGISGILTAIRFPQRLKNIELVIYEKNPEVGGTWYENRYPGVRCDIPSASYQYTFESNTQWSEYYASGPEIQRYLLGVARKYGVHKYIKFQHHFEGATWNEQLGKWEISVNDVAGNRKFVDTCDIYVSATGILNKWKWPDIEGLSSYKGKMVHSANWDPEVDVTGKTVALIGAGSSGIQILPQIQPSAKRVDHYMSGKTWISPIGFGSEELHERGVVGNFKHSKEELDKFRDKAEYMKYRHKIEKSVNEASTITFYGTPQQQAFQRINREAMAKKLEKKPHIMEALEPSFPPGCRRLTPGPGYLEALVEDNVNFVNRKIKRFVPEGIETVDGQVREVDIIICATGFDTTLKQPFPVRGLGGVSLDDVWSPDPECYFGILAPKMPNHFRFLGPNGGPGTGSLIHLVEVSCEYMIKCVAKIQREYIKSMVVSERANRAFAKHVERYFTRTIYTQPCKSWMKRGKEDGKVVTLFPGSAYHMVIAFQNPRFEDFEYEYMEETEENPLSYLGSGLTLGQKLGIVETDYLDYVDVPKAIDGWQAEEMADEKGITITGMV